MIAGASYITLGPTIDIGPLHFTVIRILIAVGFLRILVNGERITGGLNILDKLLLGWAFWAVCSSVFHEPFGEALVFRLGMAYNGLGTYFLLRIFLQDFEDVSSIFRIVILALIPIALEMINEALTGKNWFSVFGGVSEFSEIRGNKIRVQGPFAHSILAGTVGAVCLPMALNFWKSNRMLAITGILATVTIVIASRSSGPIMTLISAIVGLLLWNFRGRMRLIRWSTLIAIVALMIIMNAPVYYLLARIDLTGSSTGFHRAILIESAINYWNEWWLWGTDQTRHWTPNAGFGNDTDITNHYLRMGIWGGLPLMALFIAILVTGFASISKWFRFNENSPIEEQFLIWTLGCILLAHITTMMSVSYFDQSVFFLYLPLAAIGSLSINPALEYEVTPDQDTNYEGHFYHHS